MINDNLPERRRELVDTAARLFREQGYDRTTVRDLAEAVGLQSGSLFHHFSSKEAILLAVMQRAAVGSTEQMRRAADSSPDPVQCLRALIRAELQALHGENRDAMAVLFFQWQALSADKQAEILAYRERYEAAWLEVLGKLEASARIRTEAALLRRLLVGSIGWTIYWFRADGPLSLEQLAEAILATVLVP